MCEEENLIEKIMFTKREWPQFIIDLFPLVMLFYKVSKPKTRKRIDGYTSKLVSANPGEMRKYDFKPVKKHYRNPKTSRQNCFSYASCIVLSPDGFGTVKRSLGHKGFKKLIGAFYATDQEIEYAKNCWRYHFIKYKTIQDFYKDRELDDPRFKEMCDRIMAQYPSVFNQLALFPDDVKKKRK